MDGDPAAEDLAATQAEPAPALAEVGRAQAEEAPPAAPRQPKFAEDPKETAADVDRFSSSWPPDLSPQQLAQAESSPLAPMTPVWEGVKGFGLKELTTDAFTGAVNAHNALLERFQTIEARFTSSEKEHKKADKNFQEMAAQFKKMSVDVQDHLLRHDQRIGENHRAIQAEQEVHKQMITDYRKASEEASEQRKRELDEVWGPKFESLQKTVEEFCRQQAEMATTTLPQWQADLSGKIQKVSTDLAQLRLSTDSREQELEALINANRAAHDKAQKELEERWATEIGEFAPKQVSIKDRLIASDDRVSKLEEALAQTAARLGKADAALSEKLELSEKNMEVFVKAEVDGACALLRGSAASDMPLGEQLDGLESAFKQAEYERLRNTKDVEERLNGLESEIESSSSQASTKREALRTTMCQEIVDLRAKLELDLSSQVNELASRLASAEENATSLSKSLMTTDDRLGSTSAELLRRLEAKGAELEEYARAQAGEVRDAVKNGEGAKVANLEASSEKAQKERQELQETLRKEVDELRSNLDATQKASSSQTEEAGAALTARLEKTDEVVKGLTRDLDQLSHLQEQSDGGLHNLKERVDGIQRQAPAVDDAQKRLLEMEWYLSAERTAPFAMAGEGCLSCGRRAPPHAACQRSTSPSSRTWSSQLGARAGGLGAYDVSPLQTSVGWSQSQRPMPQEPQSARPSSARFRRPADPMQVNMQETQMPMAAGSAHSVARSFQRKGPPPPPAYSNGPTPAGLPTTHSASYFEPGQ